MAEVEYFYRISSVLDCFWAVTRTTKLEKKAIATLGTVGSAQLPCSLLNQIQDVLKAEDSSVDDNVRLSLTPSHVLQKQNYEDLTSNTSSIS